MPISKVILNGVTQMDVTDTTAEAEDVTAPEVFYSSNGTRTVGTGTGGAVLSVNGQTGTVVLDAADVGALPDTTVIPTKIDNLTIDAITEPSASFPVPAVGDNGSTLFGKISKWFSDMAALVATKFPTSNVGNNLTTTASGYALDARQGRALNSEISAMGQEVAARIKNEGNFGTKYTNVNLLPTNTIGWVNGTGGNISNLPTQSAYHMITVFPLSTHGFQIAIRYKGDAMYVRTYMHSTWSAWKNLV